MMLIFFVQTVTQAFHYIISPSNIEVKRVKKAIYFADNNKLEEFIWSSIPAIVLAVLIFYGLYAWTDIMFVNEEEEKTYCYELYAQQFKWAARYSEKMMF
jgi:cytochrome c oxidase subunit 2